MPSVIDSVLSVENIKSAVPAGAALIVLFGQRCCFVEFEVNQELHKFVIWPEIEFLSEPVACRFHAANREVGEA